MNDRFTFCVYSIGADGYLRSVGLTAEDARASLAAEADDVGADLASGYALTVTCDRADVRAAVSSLFGASHGMARAETEWAALKL